MKRPLALCLGLFFSIAGFARPFELNIAHVNDTHGYLQETENVITLPIDTNADGTPEPTRVKITLGGFPRIATCIETTRATRKNVIFLHGGDVFTGTLYSRFYRGQADVQFLNRMGVDAMVTGNHEYDKGATVLSDFAKAAQFPILSANAVLSPTSGLAKQIAPHTILTVGGEKIGVIGLTTFDANDANDPDFSFRDPVMVAKSEVGTLTAQGINKIIVLSHCGYDVDMDLAAKVSGIDVIVGAHTHALLGDSTAFGALGIRADGPYPTIVNNPDGHPVYIVTARSHTMLFADLDVIFDEQGVVTSAKGAPELLLGNTFKPMLNGQYTLVNEQSHPEIYRQIIADLDKSPVARRIAGAPWAETLLNTYKAKVDSTCAIPVAQVERDLAHVRLPGMSADGVAYPHGSEVAPIVCDAFLWAARQAGFQADVAIQNGGSIRVPLHAPACNLGTMYELLPYENRLVVVDLTGAQLREAILTGAHTALKGETGAFPYVAGCRMTIAAPDTAHIELKNLEIALPNGGFAPVDDHRIYHVVTNSYMASGGDDYAVFSKAPRQEVRCIDAEAMRRYAEHHGTIHPANDLRIEVDF